MSTSRRQALPSPVAASAGHGTIRLATFRQMVLSPLNVRRQPSGLDELAALVAANGILQNLIGFGQVVGGRASGLTEIVAGGRRLASVGINIDRGLLPEDYAIPYLLVSEAEAVQVSLAENQGREPMHPADVFDAMLALSTHGASIDDIALSFGVDALTVRRRLKLARIAPRLLALYRKGEAAFDQMMALAVSDDQAAQQQAWDSLGKHGRSPHQLRRLLTDSQIDVRSDRLARFVGIKAFERAGGVVARDLFSGDGAGYIADAPLLESLAAKKLEQLVPSLEQEGLAWVAVSARIDPSELASYGRVRRVRHTPNAQQQAELEQIDAALEQLEAQGGEGADEDDQADALEARMMELEQRRSALLQALVQDHPGDSAMAGALLSINERGEPTVHRGLIRPADKHAMAPMPAEDGAPSPAKVRPVHSERLMHVLTAQRTVAMGAEVIERPALALAVLTHSLARRLFFPREFGDKVLKLALEQPALPEEVKDSRARLALDARRAELEAAWSATDHAQWLSWLAAQPQEFVLRLMAYCVACSLDAIQERAAPHPTFEGLAQLAGLDMRAWWTPTAASYFDHIAKGRIIEGRAGADAGSGGAAGCDEQGIGSRCSGAAVGRARLVAGGVAHAGQGIVGSPSTRRTIARPFRGGRFFFACCEAPHRCVAGATEGRI